MKAPLCCEITFYDTSFPVNLFLNKSPRQCFRIKYELFVSVVCTVCVCICILYLYVCVLSTQIHCVSRCNIVNCLHNHIGTFLCQRICVSRYVCVCVSGLCSVSAYPPNTLCTVCQCTIANWMPVWNTNHPFSYCHPCPLQTPHTFKPLHHLPHFEADILDTQSVFLYLEPFTRRQMN